MIVKLKNNDYIIIKFAGILIINIGHEKIKFYSIDDGFEH